MYRVIYGQFKIKLDNNKVEQLNCSQRLKSKSSKSAVTFTFANQSNKVLELYWINYRGDDIKYHTLRRGQIATQKTFMTHPWKIKDAKTKACLGIIRATKPHYSSSIIFKTSAPRAPKPTRNRNVIQHTGVTKYTNSRLGGTHTKSQ